ncbi:sensor domain-containing diguanylate cyclase [Streptomyces sp. CNQ085]|uniref:GGDEF domain-containing protein n=1 Tax=Streptomyces sp. CNQ085 TaxID=2886944 RepID=UPI001F50EAA5|nr:sensor domain-containing diguanylate cyclase [Streptomyces sp. CNQ085]MCI0386635.1 sensor domain-containing diguanylate cyclase [Streptomyces sp. CNQ085]
MGDDARLRTVVGLAQEMAAAHTLRDAARTAAEGARAALDGSFAALSVWERERGLLRVLVNTGERRGDEEEFPEDETYPIHDFPEITGLCRGAGPGAGTRAWVETADGGSRVSRYGPAAPRETRPPALRRRGRGCCVVAPVVVDGRAWGELYVAREIGRPVFDRADADFAEALASVIAAGIAQTERLEEVRLLAFTDPLTGLANRRAVDVRLEEALERHRADGTVVSLLVCDVNGLKRVNDVLGHEAGDRLLERFASVLSLCGAMLPGTLAARLGGDEFCLLAVGPPADEVVRVADEVCLRAAELETGQGVACGVASTGDPIGPVRSARRLFRLADAAQYRAKAARTDKPVVAGREGAGAAEGPEGPGDAVVRLADRAEQGRIGAPGDRRRLRGLDV